MKIQHDVENSKALIVKRYSGPGLEIEENEVEVVFSGEAYLNATAIAGTFGRQPRDYLKNERTRSYMDSVKKIFLTGELVRIRQGGNPREQGTWLHPKLAVDFARWLNPDFAVWCDSVIEGILRGDIPAPEPPTGLNLSPRLLRAANAAYRAGADTCKLLGIVDANQVRISASRVAEKITGINPMEILDIKYLESPDDHGRRWNATELGKELGNISPKKVNALLEHLGFIAANRDENGKLIDWEIAPKGEPYMLYVDVPKAHGKRPSVRQLLYRESILEALYPLEAEIADFIGVAVWR